MKLRLALHLGALAGLLAGVLIVPVVEAYFTRGITTQPEWPPIPHTDLNPLGVNTFFNEEPDPAVVERSLDMLRDGGFGYIRQVFGWNEIEPEPGIFVDANGRSTWEKYDRIVDEAVERGIQIIARLEKPPAWARQGQPNPAIAGPPDHLADYANFVEQVVSRYRGRLTYVQIWNEPNLEGEWGGGPIDPYAYVQLLKAGYQAAKAASPESVVLLAGLAPTDQLGPQNLSDLVFLQRVYDFGGAAFFDIATVMVYGYGFSPGDRRVAFGRNNFSRPIQSHEIMVRNGDAGTPIWAVEYGWVSLPDDWDGAPSPWGNPVDRETQAAYLLDGYLRAQHEWPWMGVMAVWAFRFPRPADAPDQVGNPTRGFTIVGHDFSPEPAYSKLQHAAARIQRDYTGAYWFSPTDQARLLNGLPVMLTISGSSIRVLAHGPGTLRIMIDGQDERRVSFATSDMTQVSVADGLSDGPHNILLTLEQPHQGPSPDLLGYIVTRQPIETWIFPWVTRLLLAAFGLVGLSCAWILGRAYWQSRRTMPDLPSTAETVLPVRAASASESVALLEVVADPGDHEPADDMAKRHLGILPRRTPTGHRAEDVRRRPTTEDRG